VTLIRRKHIILFFYLEIHNDKIEAAAAVAVEMQLKMKRFIDAVFLLLINAKLMNVLF
jgi:hypothetical protein